MDNKFNGNFTQQDGLPEIAIERATRVLRSGRLHRYNLVKDEIGEVGSLELEFAKFINVKYCLAGASGAILCQLRLGHWEWAMATMF